MFTNLFSSQQVKVISTNNIIIHLLSSLSCGTGGGGVGIMFILYIVIFVHNILCTICDSIVLTCCKLLQVTIYSLISSPELCRLKFVT